MMVSIRALASRVRHSSATAARVIASTDIKIFPIYRFFYGICLSFMLAISPCRRQNYRICLLLLYNTGKGLFSWVVATWLYCIFHPKRAFLPSIVDVTIQPVTTRRDDYQYNKRVVYRKLTDTLKCQ